MWSRGRPTALITPKSRTNRRLSASVYAPKLCRDTLFGVSVPNERRGRAIRRGGPKPEQEFGAFCSSLTGHVRDNPERSRFELDIGGQIVFAPYARQGSALGIPFFETPPAPRSPRAPRPLLK